jgi:hypothetical protein
VPFHPDHVAPGDDRHGAVQESAKAACNQDHARWRTRPCCTVYKIGGALAHMTVCMMLVLHSGATAQKPEVWTSV